MLPVLLDHKVLNRLPFPSGKTITGVSGHSRHSLISRQYFTSETIGGQISFNFPAFGKIFSPAAAAGPPKRARWLPFNRLDIPEKYIGIKSIMPLFELFSKNLEESVEPGDVVHKEPSAVYPQSRPEPVPSQAKTLKERIDEARGNPDIPRPVIELIEKNKMNAAGQSGAKYTELIETLLAIPWGKIKRIWVSPKSSKTG